MVECIFQLHFSRWNVIWHRPISFYMSWVFYRVFHKILHEIIFLDYFEIFKSFRFSFQSLNPLRPSSAFEKVTFKSLTNNLLSKLISRTRGYNLQSYFCKTEILKKLIFLKFVYATYYNMPFISIASIAVYCSCKIMQYHFW